MKRVYFLAIIYIIFFTATSFAASKASEVRNGNRFYEGGNYDDAVKRYQEAAQKEPESDIINFDLGTALYKSGDYQGAIKTLQKSLLTDDLNLKQKAHYNLGNALYQQGMVSAPKDLKSAVSSLEQSLTQYDSALAIDSQDEDGRQNHKFVETELKRLKKKLAQQKQDGKNQKDQNKQNDQDQGHQSSSSQQDKNQQQNQQKKSSAENGEQKKESRDQQEQQSGNSKEQEQQAQTSREDQENKDQEGKVAHLGQLTKEEAENLLNHYRHNEEPQGLLNFMKGNKREAGVTRDW